MSATPNQPALPPPDNESRTTAKEEVQTLLKEINDLKTSNEPLTEDYVTLFQTIWIEIDAFAGDDKDETVTKLVKDLIMEISNTDADSTYLDRISQIAEALKLRLEALGG